jgi:hypothetical protein
MKPLSPDIFFLHAKDFPNRDLDPALDDRPAQPATA